MEETFILDIEARNLISFTKNHLKDENLASLLIDEFERTITSHGNIGKDYLYKIVKRIDSDALKHKANQGENSIPVLVNKQIQTAYQKFCNENFSGNEFIYWG